MSDTTDEAVNTEVVAQEPTVPESAPVEAKTPEVADSFDEVWAEESDAKPEKKEPEAETVAEPVAPEKVDKPADETPAEEQLPDEKLAPKSENRFQKLANENRQLRQQVEELNAQVYKPQTPEELVEEGMDETRALVESMRQERELEKFNSQVADAQSTLEAESIKVLQDFPIFDPKSESYRPEVAVKASQLLTQNLIIDPNTNQVIGSNISPYTLYETIAAASESSAVQGQLAGQRATEQMLANADSVGNAAPPKAKADPILEIWND